MAGNDVLQHIKRLISGGNLPHAFIVSGSDRESRMAFALDFAKEFFAYDAAAAQKIDSGSYEDLAVVEKDGAQIKVDQVAELTHLLQNKPFIAKGIMAVIADGEAMMEESQNKLLKTLEEPNPGNLILILCDNPGALFATVRSRCVPIRLDEAQKPLDAEYYEAARSIVSAALFDASAPMNRLFGMLEPFAQEAASAEGLLDHMEAFLRDLIVGGYSMELPWHPENAALIAKTGRRWEKYFVKYVTIVEAARADLGRKMNRRHCLRSMAVRMRQETINDKSS